ncbi:hypothetical protein [Streptomyces sp. NPDC053813]|uniref:hypothetical protein n=1 Tax=Streptomyces sp. NPDC053813 TaxID=3365717 RepID=UPI0037D38119
MIRAHHRLKGGAAELGATGPGRAGPFGLRPADDHQDDDDQHHEPADRAGETRTA